MDPIMRCQTHYFQSLCQIREREGPSKVKKKERNPSISLHGPLGDCTIPRDKRIGPTAQVLPLSANRVTREGSGHLAMPPRRLPMVHQPIRFHIVLHEALRVARRGRKTRGDTEREETGQRCLIRCC